MALVESEKTAIISSALMPQYTWLATGGKSGLTSERLSSLKGRKIIVFPDVGFSVLWSGVVFKEARDADVEVREGEDFLLPVFEGVHIGEDDDLSAFE